MTSNNAHPPIEPTDPTLTPERAAAGMTGGERVVYEVAWSHMLAAAAEQPRVVLCEAELALEGSLPAQLQGLAVTLRGIDVLDAGWWDHLPDKGQEYARSRPNTAAVVKAVADHPDLVVKGEYYKRHPEPLQLDQLLMLMAGYGVGRPSTYHTTLHLMADKGLISWDANTGQVRLTEAGLTAALTLRGNAPEVSGVEFVAHLNELIDRVANGALAPNAALLEVVERLHGVDAATAVAGAVWTTPDQVGQVFEDGVAGLLSGPAGVEGK